MTSKPTNERIAVLETEIKTVKATVTKIESNQSANHADLANKIELLTDSIDGRFTDHENRIKVAEETLEPLTKFRKRLWGIVVVSALTIATVAVVLAELKRYQ